MRVYMILLGLLAHAYYHMRIHVCKVQVIIAKTELVTIQSLVCSWPVHLCLVSAPGWIFEAIFWIISVIGMQKMWHDEKITLLSKNDLLWRKSWKNHPDLFRGFNIKTGWLLLNFGKCESVRKGSFLIVLTS